MRTLIVAVFLLAVGDAFAQDASSRIALTIGQLTIQVHQQQDQIMDLEMKLAKAQARIKQLEEAAKPKESK